MKRVSCLVVIGGTAPKAKSIIWVLALATVLTATGTPAGAQSPAWLSHGPTTMPGAFALAINPTTPTTLYVGYGGGDAFGSSSGLFKSLNGGESWSGANTGLGGAKVIRLAIDPTTPNTL